MDTVSEATIKMNRVGDAVRISIVRAGDGYELIWFDLSASEAKAISAGLAELADLIRR